MQTIVAQSEFGVKGSPGAWPDMDVLTTGGQVWPVFFLFVLALGCLTKPPIQGCRATPPTMQHCPGQTDDEYQTELSLWSIFQSPLWVATDVRNMTGAFDI